MLDAQAKGRPVARSGRYAAAGLVAQPDLSSRNIVINGAMTIPGWAT